MFGSGPLCGGRPPGHAPARALARNGPCGGEIGSWQHEAANHTRASAPNATLSKCISDSEQVLGDIHLGSDKR